MFNAHCKECWPYITTNEKKSIDGFCNKCGYGTWVTVNDVLTCKKCGQAEEAEKTQSDG